MNELVALALLVAAFLLCWFFPVEAVGDALPTSLAAVGEALALVRWYAREHVLLCLLPAFLIAGAIGVFVRQGAVLRYLGPTAPKRVAYPMAATSGTILAVCSCTVLPLFASIHKRGAGLGPATAFLYSGPALSVLAIVLTANVLGPQLGLARAGGAIVFAVVIGLLMHTIFRREEAARQAEAPAVVQDDEARALWKDGLLFLGMVGFLVFANWSRPTPDASPLWTGVYDARWVVAGLFAALSVAAVLLWLDRDEVLEWADASWGFAKQILPLLLVGVLVAGLLLGSPDGSGEGLLPRQWVANAVGGNSVDANAFAAVAGAFMYFATLTEIPILEGLLGAGMGQGPALSLLLAGPALSLPNMLVIRSVLGTKKTLAYVGLVVVLSTVAGLVYGAVV